MTEKRFTLTKGFDEHERQIRDNGKIIMGCFHEVQAKPIVDLLNALHEENTTLKSSNMEMEDYLGRIEEEIKELKEIGDYQSNRIKELDKENQQLNESRDELIHENRHIKNTIQTMLINERTHIGKSVLKQLWDRIQ